MIQLLQVFLLAMTPIGELRAAIPVGLGVFHLNWLSVFVVSVIGNLVPVVFLLLFLEPISKFLSQNFKIFNRFFFWLFERTKKRTPLGNKKYTLPALALFVARRRMTRVTPTNMGSAVAPALQNRWRALLPSMP